MKKKMLFLAVLGALAVVVAVSIVYTFYSMFSYINICQKVKQNNIENETILDIALSYTNGGQKGFKGIVESDNAEYAYTYEVEGVIFASYDNKYNKEKLRKAADELLSNTYGDEINYLSKVEVILDENTEISAECVPLYKNVPFAIKANGILPENLSLSRKYEYSVIKLYLPDENVDVRDFAYVLSREYGRHFAKFNFNLSDTANDMNSYYYKIRAAGFEDRIILDESMVTDENLRKWLLSEIAAHDYVYLLGSETVHNVEEFMDTVEKHEFNKYAIHEPGLFVFPYFVQCINGIPHINPSIDMPIKINDLVEYFYSFVDSNPPIMVNDANIADVQLSVSESVKNFYYITWDKPYEDKDVLYTVIVYDEYDNVLAIAYTNYGDKRSYAYFGEYTGRPSEYYGYRENNFYYEDGEVIKFRISVTFPDGTVLLSDCVEKIY